MSRASFDRPVQAWRALEREQRLAALAAVGLFVSMFLPWYSKADTFIEHGTARATQTSLSAFQSFSFVEAAVLLVSAGVLAMLFARGEERDFQLPGGDGLIVMVAGAWVALLVFYRLLDKPGLQASQRITATVGVEWGIFIALLLALGLFYAGQRMRAEERPEPPLVRRRARTEDPGPRAGRGPAEAETRPVRPVRPVSARAAASGDAGAAAQDAEDSLPTPPGPGEHRSASGRGRYPPAPSQQMSFEDSPPKRSE